MKLLVVTQAVDTQNPVLGFFHRWLEELAPQVESIEVICLEKGEYNLPQNVHVHSLGKENGKASRIIYAQRFLKLVHELKDDYDIVFVHMNQEYVLLAGLLWNMWKKPIFFWRNHKVGNWLTDRAVSFADVVYCTTPLTYVGKFKKTKLMPVGIDTERFSANAQTRTQGSILSLGRLAPVKRLEVLLDACELLSKKGVSYKADVYGDALPIDTAYANALKESSEERKLSVEFLPGIPNAETPRVYSTHDVFVNLTNTGSFDKTLFEAMACGSLVVTSNKALEDVVPQELFFKEYDAASLTDTLQRTLALPDDTKETYRKEYRAYVEARHSLNLLIKNLVLDFTRLYEARNKSSKK